MNMQHLRYFAAVMECGSVSRAAERLGVTQPTLSAALKRLEAEFGVRLFVPFGRGLKPAPAAERLVGPVRTALRALAEARADLTSQRRLRLGLIPSLTQTWLASILACFDARVELVEAPPDVLASRLSRGALDLAATVLPDDWDGDAVALWREPFHLFVGRGHPLAAQPSVRVETLRELPFVLRRNCEKAGTARRLIEALRIRLSIVARTDQEAVAARLVALGRGVTLAPANWGYPDLVSLPLEGFKLSRLVGLAWRGDGGRRAAERLGRHLKSARP